MPNLSTPWNTADEMEFIHGLGHWSLPGTDAQMAGRAMLLDHYLRAARHRKNWFGIDRDACLEFARSEKEALSRSG